ncbi:MAG: glycoside hydrolase family 43 protein [Telluria sp.]
MPIHRLSLPALLALALLDSCGGGGGAAPVGAPAPVTPAPSPVPAPSSLGDFPDPFVLAEQGAPYYAYATNAQGKHVQLARSTDLHAWSALPDAMPALASWINASSPNVWAPEVAHIGTSYVLYYTAHDAASGRQCVGAAVAAAPTGPFVDKASAPLVCQAAEGGTIDPSPLAVGGKLYLYFKSDGNCCHLPTRIYAQELSADGLAVTGSPVALLANERAWEGAVIEAPTMFVKDGRYLLFYSGNDYSGPTYATGYASCTGPLGPCTPAADSPILTSRLATEPKLIGPGHQDVFQVGDQTWIAYHAWEELPSGTQGTRRFLYIDKLDWVDGRPVVRGPTMVP